ncbi:MAG: heavy metal translocating P-type ATPase [Verrucomicrobiota bacterium]
MSPSDQPPEPGLQADQRLVDRAWLRIGIGLAVAGQTMVFSLGLNLTPAEGASRWVVHGALIALSVAVLVFLGRDLLGSAWRSLRDRRVTIDLLFLLTLLGALGASLVSTFTGVGAVFYEIVAILVVVHTAGKMLGARSRVAALRAADGLRADFARCRALAPDGAETDKPVADLAPGDLVLVAPGGAVAVDGEIVDGRAYLRETALTGEWAPAARGPGDAVLAGSYSVDGYLRIRPAPGPRRIDRLLAQVEQARIAPSRLQEQADRLMAWFLPVVVAVSLGTFAGWWWAGPWEQALFNAMAVLLVACPCALGLATPVAVWGGLARLASMGVVARTGDFLDGLARVDTVCLDKTGTLSEERLQVTGWTYASDAWRDRSDWLRAAVAAAERDAAHPVARALVDAAAGLPPVTVTHRELIPGCGLIARVPAPPAAISKPASAPASTLRIGTLALHPSPAPQSICHLLSDKLSVTQNAEEQATKSDCNLISDKFPGVFGAKVVGVSVDGEWAAVVAVGEVWRAGLDEAAGELAGLGLRAEVLTGDPHPPQGLPVPVSSGLSPEDKVARVKALAGEGRSVLFVGDGINDAAAMAESTVSVAMGGGSELARASATAVFTGSDLRCLPESVRLARTVVRGMRGNLRFASAYNAVGMALAAAGVLHPVVAALLMVGSSAFVSIKALRSSGGLKT